MTTPEQKPMTPGEAVHKEIGHFWQCLYPHMRKKLCSNLAEVAIEAHEANKSNEVKLTHGGLTYGGRAVRFLVDKLQEHYHFTDQECNMIAQAGIAADPVRATFSPLLTDVMRFLEDKGSGSDGSQELHARILDLLAPAEAEPKKKCPNIECHNGSVKKQVGLDEYGLFICPTCKGTGTIEPSLEVHAAFEKWKAFHPGAEL